MKPYENLPPKPAEAERIALRRRFQSDFVWGVATSSFQIEGAAQEDGRGDSIWDEFCRRPGVILDASDGVQACDHYHRYAEDVELIASLNVRAYRFSIAWPRVQPTGEGAWNEQGFAFYDRLINKLLERGIAPHITLYHWDLPQALQESGGWVNRDTVLRFVDYAAEVGRRFGSRAASIVTHNEPWVVSILGHESGIFAPGIKSRKAAMQVSHHLLLSHGLAVQALRAQGLAAPLGIVLNQSPFHPATNSPADRAKARLDDGLNVRWYMNSLFFGRYPDDVLSHLGSDAPEILDGDMEHIRQPLDFIGINYYTRCTVSADPEVQMPPPGAEVTDMGWEVCPDGLTELLLRLHADYPLPPLYITENGAAFPDQIIDGEVADADRTRFVNTHIAALADAMEAGVDVRGYFLWSLMDNFEWASGYSKRFGIVYVDHVTQKRTLKESAFWYRNFVSGK